VPSTKHLHAEKKSSGKSVLLPSNKIGVTLNNWKVMQKLAYKLLLNPTRLNSNQALKIIQGILDLQPPGCDVPTLQVNLGSIYLAQNQLKEAIQIYFEAISAAPTAWKAHYNLALALIRVGRLLEGKKHLSIARDINPTHNATHLALAEIQQTIHTAALQTIEQKKEKQCFSNQLSDAIKLMSKRRLHCFDTNIFKASQDFVSTSAKLSIPLTKLLSSGWIGPLAGIVHRLHVHASIRDQTVMDIFQSVDVDKCGYVKLEVFSNVYCNLCRSELSKREEDELNSFFTERY